MAKKIVKKTLRSQYTEILTDRDIPISKCKILSYKFPDVTSCHAFHFDLMNSNMKYSLFDGTNENGIIIISKDDLDLPEKINILAVKNNGKEYNINID